MDRLIENAVPLLFALYFIASAIYAVVKRLRTPPPEPRPRRPARPAAPPEVEEGAPSPEAAEPLVPLPSPQAYEGEGVSEPFPRPDPVPRLEPRRAAKRPKSPRLPREINRRTLREAVLLAEILGPPRSMRPFSPWRRLE